MARALNKESANAARGRGSNVPDELVQQRYAAYVKLKQDEEKALDEYKSAQAYSRKHLKACKADGITPSQFTKLYAESKLDPILVAQDRAEENRLREILNMQIRTGDLFPETLNAAPGRSDNELDKHYSAGLSAAEAGKTDDSHGLRIGSPEEIAWTKGFKAKLAEAFGGAKAPATLAEAGAGEVAAAQAAAGNGKGKRGKKANGGDAAVH
ncbi:MAG: hypothetical protein KBC46_03355 [Ferrovibrio sp.]|nr:hypothetical protein [Ferrovibrio sp.]